jgi:hypothetical protein
VKKDGLQLKEARLAFGWSFYRCARFAAAASTHPRENRAWTGPVGMTTLKRKTSAM